MAVALGLLKVDLMAETLKGWLEPNSGNRMVVRMVKQLVVYLVVLMVARWVVELAVY